MAERTSETLQKLDSWLIGNGIPTRRAIFTSESIGNFCNKWLFEREVVKEVVLTATVGEYGARHVFLSSIWAAPFQLSNLEQSTKENEFTHHFVHSVSIPLLPDPCVHLGTFLPEDPEDLLNPSGRFREHCQQTGCEFLGILTKNNQ